MRGSVVKIGFAILTLVAAGSPAAWSQPESDGQFYAYCSNPPGYFPYVTVCKVPWRKVAPPNQEDKGEPIPLVSGRSDEGAEPQAEQPATSIETPPSPPPEVEKPSVPSAAAPPAPIEQRSVSAPPVTPPARIVNPVPQPPAAPKPKPAEFGGYLVAPLFFALALLPLCLTHRANQNEASSERIIRSLRRWPNRKNYLWAIGVATVVLAIGFSPFQSILIGGVVAAGFVVGLFGRARIDDNDTPTGSVFPEAARQIASLRSVQQHNHFHAFNLRWTSKFQGISSANPFLVIYNGSRVMIMTPTRYWVRVGSTYSSGPTQNIRVRAFDYNVSTDRPFSDDTVKGRSWRHMTKAGHRDLRYKDNPETVLVMRFGIEIILFDDLTLDLAEMTKSQRDQTFAAFKSFLDRPEKIYRGVGAIPDIASSAQT